MFGLPLNLIIYACIALALMGAVAGFIHKEREAGRDEVRAELLPKLESCQADIRKQNDAVSALAAESAKRQARSAQALSKASESAKVWEDNAARLRAVLTAPRPAGEAAPLDCRAAWAEISK